MCYNNGIMLSWARRRQLGYFIALVVFFGLIILAWWYTHQTVPTCFDGLKNQDEREVDCGGVCVAACRADVKPLSVPWSRVFQTGVGTYDAAALVRNPNYAYGLREIEYKFRVYDDQGILITERSGKTSISPKEEFVIFEPNIATGARLAAEAYLYFAAVDQGRWERLTALPPKINLTDKQYTASPYPKLLALAENDSLGKLKAIPFVAVLSDGSGNAYAASATFLETIDPHQTASLIFTWPPAAVGSSTLPATIDIYPKLNLFTTPQ